MPVATPSKEVPPKPRRLVYYEVVFEVKKGPVKLMEVTDERWKDASKKQAGLNGCLMVVDQTPAPNAYTAPTETVVACLHMEPLMARETIERFAATGEYQW